MDYQEQDMIESLKNFLIKLQENSFNLDDNVKKTLDNILKHDVEIKQPNSVRGVRQLLCAIHTYKI